MHGLVREWCADWYTTSLAGGDDPVGPAAGSDRVSRGGYWHFDASDCRSAYRSFFDRSYRYDGSGFRVVVLR
jgi:formylglycine-generating enzyme required for sulfatase activity